MVLYIRSSVRNNKVKDRSRGVDKFDQREKYKNRRASNGGKENHFELAMRPRKCEVKFSETKCDSQKIVLGPSRRLY